jgi:hypothetical protein
MPNNSQEHLNEIIKKEKMFYLDLGNRDLVGDMNLKDFANLKSINASNNKFTNLNFLNSLTNKDKLENINFFGNEINEIDFNSLFTQFPKLKTINLDNNPLSLKNLEQLSAEKLSFLVETVANKKIRMSSWKGTLTLDLLKTFKNLKEQLASTGANYRREIPLQNQMNTNKQQPRNNFGLLIPVVGISLIIGSFFTYFLLKSQKKPAKYE